MNRAYFNSPAAFSSEVQPEAILREGDNPATRPIISALTIGGATVYILSDYNPQYYTRRREAVIAAYGRTVAHRVSFKRDCTGRNAADRTIQAILDWVEEYVGKHGTWCAHQGQCAYRDLDGIDESMIAINKRLGFGYLR